DGTYRPASPTRRSSYLLLPHRRRQREEEIAKRQARPRHRPAPVARGTQGDELRCRHRPLSGHGGHSDRESSGARSGNSEDVGKGGETTPHGQTPPDRLPSALPGEQQFLETG